ncbi:hypothetical protein DGM98_07180 [Xanthomonas citri]|nr:hypothetical protein DGM98_07180 [Xanthomonas citri]
MDGSILREADKAPARAGRGKPQAQAAGCRPEPGQGDAPGGGHKKTLRAPQKRNWVARLRERFGVSERRALRIVAISPENTGPKRIPWRRKRSKSLPTDGPAIGGGSEGLKSWVPGLMGKRSPLVAGLNITS